MSRGWKEVKVEEEGDRGEIGVLRKEKMEGSSRTRYGSSIRSSI